MTMTREEMLALLGSRDASYNGQFIIGVHSTGIYCLPSCTAKTPKAENVQFYANCEEARRAGLRACKRCRPDEWERGEDRELESLENLVAKMRSTPSEFSSVSELADTLAVGSTKLHELFRIHYQTTPAELLLNARLTHAKSRLILHEETISETAYEVGFESLSVFNENFKRRLGLTPTEYRELRSSDTFSIRLPQGYNLATFRKSFGRDPESPTERLAGDSGCLITAEGNKVRFELGERVQVCTSLGAGIDAYESLYRVMGLAQDVRGFEQLVVDKGFGQLVEDGSGARIPQTLSLYDGLIWVIVGQQINLPFAYRLRRRIHEMFGEPRGGGLYTTPRIGALAEATPQQLLPLQFSGRKAEYLIGVAQLGEAWFAALERMSFTRAQKTLLETRGLGTWSAEYLLMRALGFSDCVPYGDTGLRSGLEQLYGLAEKPDLKRIEVLMEPFAPYRSLATYHLWRSLK